MTVSPPQRTGMRGWLLSDREGIGHGSPKMSYAKRKLSRIVRTQVYSRQVSQV